MLQGRGLQATAVAIPVAGAAAVLAAGATFTLDDAYITLHNAQSLLSGRDENYGVSPLIGATSPIHLALTALALLAIAPPTLAALAIATLGGVAYLLGVAALAAQMQLRGWRSFALVAIAAGAGYSAYHLFNGLETPWAMAAVTWALVLADKPRPGRSLPLLCGLLPFLRPELAALSGLLMTLQAWRRWRAEQHWLRALVIDLALCGAAATPWIAWLLLDIGTVSPGAGMAKRAFFAESGLPAPHKLWATALALVFGLGAPLVALVMTPRNGLTIVCWTFTLVFAAAYAVAFPGGLTHNHHRYVYLLLPLCIWGLARLHSPRLLAIMLVVCLAGATLSTALSIATYAQGRKTMQHHLALAEWAQRHLPADARILVHDAGAPAYATDRVLIDLVGLKTPSSAPVHGAVTEPSRGARRGEAIHAIALQAHPDYALILNDDPAFWGQIADHLTSYGWTLSPVGPQYPDYRLYALGRAAD